jgi:Tfp pilus assembly protein PilN
MIVMGAFLSRFWLDAQNSDLTDQVKTESAEIAAQADFETQFRGIQTKLKLFKDIGVNAQTSKKLDLIASKIPSDLILSNMSVNTISSDLKGIASSETSIAQFLSNLKAEPIFKQVTLGSLSSSETDPTKTSFSIKIIY